MTGSTLSSADLPPRRRRLLFRAWHRGMREMDLVLGRFADAKLGTFDDAEIDALEHLMEAQDADLHAWFIGTKPVPPEHDGPMLAALRRFHVENPLNNG
ncbi:FAD assembly factor SdhE [Methylobrevis albus]|uniref:FAD assembly factor SdhE n=1 Tax=Methylobrevis albus TaxID=2793297 RepID=A0A931I5C5_9HYPH|nr:succinate dehydrogenase assembly factor 2 [Methylobrevis albus]MBH0239734.1 succinate dehydrogenase assembly factor 2 [Methylobrevis albus]